MTSPKGTARRRHGGRGTRDRRRQATLAAVTFSSGTLLACGVTNCAELVLPVRWAGSMPTTEQTVRIEGEVQESAGKMIFVASRLEVMPTEGAK
jgi:hypothetical protein